MSRKNVIKSFKTIEDGDMSDATITSPETDVMHLDNIGAIISWAGTSPVGVITVEVKSGDSEWSELDFGSVIAVTGNSGTHNLNINQVPFEKIRFIYTKTSGVGALQATISAKMI